MRSCVYLVLFVFGVSIHVAIGEESAAARSDLKAMVPQPGGWEAEIGAHDGFAWYRAYVHVPSDWDGSRLLLIAGEIDNVDEGFFNGRKVGANGAMPPLYSNPASSVRRPFVVEPDWVNFGGENLIAWRVYDKADRGGIVRGPVHLTRTDDAIDLAGNWEFRRGDSSSWSQWENEPGSPEANAEALAFRQRMGGILCWASRCCPRRQGASRRYDRGGLQTIRREPKSLCEER